MRKYEIPARAAELKAAALEQIYTKQLQVIRDSDGPVFFIAGWYPGVWLEQTYDSVEWAIVSGDTSVAHNQIGLYFKHQRPDGHLPMNVKHSSIGYRQIQECMALGRLCLDVFRMDGDRAFLETAYHAISAWDGWLVANRMPNNLGLIEMYCGFDTGHDESGRFLGVKYPHNVGADAADFPEGCPVFPGVAPDMNAVFFGNREALAEMASILGKSEEAAAWRAKAEDVRRRMLEMLWDEEDEFFYDFDKYGNKRKVLSISVTNVLTERVPDQAMADRIFHRHLWNEKEFRTPYAFPAVAISDPTWVKSRTGNSWGYYSQGQTILRAFRWMPQYGWRNEHRELLEIWLRAYCDSFDKLPFGQEFDPITGEPSEAAPWYSSAMLLFLRALDELERANRE